MGVDLLFLLRATPKNTLEDLSGSLAHLILCPCWSQWSPGWFFRQSSASNCSVLNYEYHTQLPESSSTIDNILHQYKNSDVASTNSEYHPTSQSHHNVSHMIDASGLFSDCHDGRYTTNAPPPGRIGMPRSIAQNDIASTAPASGKHGFAAPT
ncbi:hypothetical protein V8E51_007690 [Hyaloscypha variabilis]